MHSKEHYMWGGALKRALYVGGEEIVLTLKRALDIESKKSRAAHPK